jgi:23S rRNA pseudouridine1911/1915/1917 synthase
VQADGMPSHTVFNLLRKYGAFSLLEAELKTGRTHQIRVHLAHIQHPLMGDGVYGPHFKTKASSLGPLSKAALESLDRQALHAYLLALEHPRSGEILEWTAELPDDLATLRSHLTLTE